MNIESMAMSTNNIEGKINFAEKHKNWFENAKESIDHNWHDFALRSLMTITLLAFAQQEAKHLTIDPRYDFKSTLGYGLYLRGRGENTNQSNNIVYEQ